MDARNEMRRGRLTPVLVSHDDWPWPETLVATDLNPFGMFVATERILPVGEEVRVSYRLGTPEVLEHEAVVARARTMRRQADLGWSGIGLALVGASATERRRIRALLRGVPPPLPVACAWEDTDAVTVVDRRSPGRRGGRRRDDAPRRFWSRLWRRV